MKLFDTHTHFDVPDFDIDRATLASEAKQRGVEALVLIGITRQRFDVLWNTHQWLSEQSDRYPRSYFAPGLHPFYIKQHQNHDLYVLEQYLQQKNCVAIGEIGLDTFLKQHREPKLYERQQYFFKTQLELAKQYNKPVLLHIRKAHADVLKMLKAQHFTQGGIAHAFSGGVQEAKAFIQLGFKLGVTGQITNVNAKKLHRVVQEVGLEHLVIETDCPDMTPVCCQHANTSHTRNVPANLTYACQSLADALKLDVPTVAEQLWKNSVLALKLKSSEFCFNN
ncbi:TatD family hydrolase [Acinetobacter sp. B10A]|uniref:TatD family hydrolase n=1 Tax=Acinetobacter baretiae TaxID=2605383 RepID=UPI001B3C66E4|nr:TatD family hydrolase [Acinetobacter baretiae]MBF7684497.1 TatD family hydrolase [Acinetobacter baretiae]